LDDRKAHESLLAAAGFNAEGGFDAQRLWKIEGSRRK
jgi:hypothetical protein